MMRGSKYYNNLRQEISKQVVTAITQKHSQLNGHLKITPLDIDARLALISQWPKNPDVERSVGTPEEWIEKIKEYIKKYSARMELAMWHDQNLCAVMLGKVSRKRLTLKINYLEGASNITFLNGFRLEIAILYAEAFASALNIKWVGIQNPYDGVIPAYKINGYTQPDPFDKKNNALYKEIQP